ncbi:MAG: sugar-binding protein, partial [Planctomycetota bacterium]
QRTGAQREHDAGRKAAQQAHEQVRAAEAVVQRDRLDPPSSSKRLADGAQKLAEADKHLVAAEKATASQQIADARKAVQEALGATNDAANQRDPAARTQAVDTADHAIAAAKLATQAAVDALGAGSDREAYARQDLRQHGEQALKAEVEKEFAGEFRAETVPRLTPKLAKEFKAQLEQSGMTNDKLVEAVAKRASELLADKVPKLAKAGEPVADQFQTLAPGDATVANTAKNPKAIDVGLSAAGKAQPAATPSALDKQLDAGKAAMATTAKGALAAIAKDGSQDARLMKLAGTVGQGDEGDIAEADMRDRIHQMAEAMRGGRLGDLGVGAGFGLGGSGGDGFNGIRGNFSGRRNEAAYRALSKQIDDRGQVQGVDLERTGAKGETSQAEERKELVPARIVGRDNAKEKVVTGNTEPYKPGFKSLAFAAIPCLPGEFAIDGGVEKWKDIPAISLNPEKGKDASPQTVQIGWRNDGLFCRYTVCDPNRRMDKNTADYFWVADVVEVWVDSLNAKQKYRSLHTGQQFWIWPDGAKDNPNMIGGESVCQKRNAAWFRRDIPKGALPRVTTMTANGYCMEFQLPARMIQDADLAPGRIVGFNTVLSVGIPGTDWYWSAGSEVGTFRQPDTWGDLLLAGSDASITLADRDQTKAKANTPAVLLPGQPLKLRVVDGDMNLSPLRRDKVMVTLKPAHGGQLLAVLEETSEASGAFEGSVTTALALDEDQPGILSVYEGEKVMVKYNDQARANGARNVDVQLTLSFGSALIQKLSAH